MTLSSIELLSNKMSQTYSRSLFSALMANHIRVRRQFERIIAEIGPTRAKDIAITMLEKHDVKSEAIAGPLIVLSQAIGTRSAKNAFTILYSMEKKFWGNYAIARCLLVQMDALQAAAEREKDLETKVQILATLSTDLYPNSPLRQRSHEEYLQLFHAAVIDRTHSSIYPVFANQLLASSFPRPVRVPRIKRWLSMCAAAAVRSSIGTTLSIWLGMRSKSKSSCSMFENVP